MKVKFENNPQAEPDYPDLTPGRIYNVIGIEADDLRLLNDEGQPYLYPHDLFVVVDEQEQADWQTEYGEEGERYAYPPELGRPGFFEDYFDGNPLAIHTFRRYLARQRALRSVAIS
jgi:hypothetical protein